MTYNSKKYTSLKIQHGNSKIAQNQNRLAERTNNIASARYKPVQYPSSVMEMRSRKYLHIC